MRPATSAVRSYWRILRGSRRTAAGAVAVAGASGIAEALGLASLLPLLSVATDASWSALWPLVLGIAGFLVAATLLRLLSDALIGKVTTDIELLKRIELMDALAEGPWPPVSNLTQGEITSAVMSEATQISNGVYALLVSAANSIVILALASVAAILTPSLLALTIVFGVISVSIFLSRVRRIRDNERSLSIEASEISESISSTLSEIKYLRESGTELWWLKRSTESSERLATLRRRQIWLPSVTRSMVDAVGAVFLAGVIALAILLLDDLAAAIVFVALFYRIIPRLQVVQANTGISLGQLEWDRRWTNRLNEIHDYSQSHLARLARAGDIADGSPLLNLDSVTFSYANGARVLSNVSLSIEQGEHIGIIGPSGGGKTTLLDVVLGLSLPQSGRVLVNGEILGSTGWRNFRSTIGLVPQDVPVVRGTIAENISWDRPFDLSRAEKVAEAAQLTDFIRSRVAGWDTIISSRATGISGGQRQRIGLARALYREPRMLILDEATSALDMVTEQALLATIRSTWTGLSVVVVSHRPAALEGLDAVYKIEGGVLRNANPTEPDYGIDS